MKPGNQCTFWPDGNWGHCCLLHDLAYDLGIPRGQADAELYQCIIDATGLGWLATLMFAGVTLFGWIFYKRKELK